mmetsp:Transcript_112309/g.250909  ORF Transcript_112309/g.250909 Transcript_112309/m.250909 type:complete len:187 (-) Transcript_112309:123-683(-)
MDFLASPRPYPAASPEPRESAAAVSEATDAQGTEWKQHLESRQWELTFKVESLSLQQEQLDSHQREQAARIAELTAELAGSAAERAELRRRLDDSRDAVSSLRLENENLREAVRAVTATLAASTGTIRRLQEKLEKARDVTDCVGTGVGKGPAPGSQLSVGEASTASSPHSFGARERFTPGSDGEK